MSDFMKLDSTRLDQAAKSQSGAGPAQASPKGADIDAFNRAMGRTPKSESEGASRGLLERNPSGQLRSEQYTQGEQGVPGKTGECSETPTGRTFPDGVSRREPQGDGQRGKAGKDGNELGGQERQKTDTPLNQIFSQMSNPLENLFSGRMPEVVSTGGAAAPHDIGDIADRLVERILVSQPDDGSNEIRIKLGNDVLPDTEIRLLRGTDGRLEIRLETQNASSFQTLVGAQDTLKGQLERLEKNVVITVSERSGTDAESGDSRQRSRGQYIDEDEQRWR